MSAASSDTPSHCHTSLEQVASLVEDAAAAGMDGSQARAVGVLLERALAMREAFAPGEVVRLVGGSSADRSALPRVPWPPNPSAAPFAHKRLHLRDWPCCSCS